MKNLGTTSDLALFFKNASADERNEFKDECNEENDRREARVDGDKWSEMQERTKPDIDEKFIGYKIEMLFEYLSDDGSQYLD